MQLIKTKLIFRRLLRNTPAANGKAGLLAYFQLNSVQREELDALILSLILADDFGDQMIEACLTGRGSLAGYYRALPG